MDGFDFKRVGHLIHLPPDHEISMMIAIGRAEQPAHDRPGLLPAQDLIFDDGFPHAED